jgi:cell division protein ZapA (FtsZ GTPase activity inhibitor)
MGDPLSVIFERLGHVEQATQDLRDRIHDLRDDFRGLQLRLNAIILAALVGPTVAILIARVWHF